MKTKLILTTILSATASLLSIAQEIQMDDLTIPAAPAVTIMGEQPMEISRPKTLNQLETNLINSFTDGQSFILPEGLALEFMPFWLSSRPSYHFDYAKAEKNESSFLKHLSLSVGTINKNVGDTSWNSRVGFGFRSQIFSGKLSKESLDTLKAIRKKFVNTTRPALIAKTRVNQLSGTVSVTPDQIMSKLEKSILSDFQTNNLSLSDAGEFVKWLEKNVREIYRKEKRNMTENEVKTQLKKIIDDAQIANDANVFATIETTTTDFAKTSERIRLNRIGWKWEVAGATYVDFPTQAFTYSQVPRLGLWSNISYTFKKPNISLILQNRYIHDFLTMHENGKGQGANMVDNGLSLSIDVKRFSMALEGILRYQWLTEREELPGGWTRATPITELDYRVALNVGYRISDKIMVTYTFGKTFSQSLAINTPLVNQVSLNFGFGDVPLKL
jgi:hypothetical protein